MPALAAPSPFSLPPPALFLGQRVESAVVDKYLMSRPTTTDSLSVGPLPSSKKLTSAQAVRAAAEPQIVAAPRSPSEQVLVHAAQLKSAFLVVSMHFEPRWRERIFKQIDRILDPEDWDHDETMPNLASFQTLLRALIFIKASRVPGLGLSGSGMLIASWSTDGEHLTVECHPNDLLKWSLLVIADGTQVAAAGSSATVKLPNELQPYRTQRWF